MAFQAEDRGFKSTYSTLLLIQLTAQSFIHTTLVIYIQFIYYTHNHKRLKVSPLERHNKLQLATSLAERLPATLTMSSMHQVGLSTLRLLIRSRHSRTCCPSQLSVLQANLPVHCYSNLSLFPVMTMTLRVTSIVMYQIRTSILYT